MSRAEDYGRNLGGQRAAQFVQHVQQRFKSVSGLTWVTMDFWPSQWGLYTGDLTMAQEELRQLGYATRTDDHTGMMTVQQC